MRYAILAFVLAGLFGCSVSFDPEGQPCDAKRGCLAGYRCDLTNHCIKSGSSGSSGSSGTGSTSGSTGSSTSGSSGSSGSSGGATCATLVCAAGQECVTSSGAARCAARTSGTCSASQPCGNPGEICISPGAGAGTGLCVSNCTLSGTNTCPAGSSCTAVTGERGNTFSACVPTPLPKSCTRSADCGAGLACLPFDSSAAGSSSAVVNNLPVLYCDAPDLSALALGASCTGSSACQSGLCILQGGGGTACAAPCASDTDCATGQSCRATAVAGVSRHAMACVPAAATACLACGSCGPDAPACGTSTGRCALVCDTADIAPCGFGRNCVLDGTVSYCEVNGGLCP